MRSARPASTPSCPATPRSCSPRRASLAKQGYSERKINTVVGPWGFNLVLDPPSGTKVDGTAEGKAAALVLQATAIGPNKLNLNVRFEGL